jgi:hypothetical protein
MMFFFFPSSLPLLDGAPALGGKDLLLGQRSRRPFGEVFAGTRFLAMLCGGEGGESELCGAVLGSHDHPELLH